MSILQRKVSLGLDCESNHSLTGVDASASDEGGNKAGLIICPVFVDLLHTCALIERVNIEELAGGRRAKPYLRGLLGSLALTSIVNPPTQLRLSLRRAR